MPFQDLNNNVLLSNLCASCGACELACPADIIQMDGLYPKLLEKADTVCGTCTDCLTVCPGLDTGVPESEQKLFGRQRKVEERWLGIYSSVHAGYSTDLDIFNRSASGGSVTTLLGAAIKCLNLDCVIVAGRDPERPWRAASMVCSDTAEIAQAAQSTYQLFPHLSILKNLFRGNPSLRVGLVGIACHIQALRKLQRMDSFWGKVAREQILFAIEIACSSSTLPEGTETIITDLMNMPLENVEDVRYREGEYPGEFVVRSKNGEKNSISLWEAVRHFKNYKTHRCLSCGDWMSGLADISVCDGDPNIFKASQEEGSQYGKYGTILVRTQTGEKVLNWAKEAGNLQTWSSTLEGANLGLDRKRNRRAHYENIEAPISTSPIPTSPIPGYKELIDIIPDEQLILGINK